MFAVFVSWLGSVWSKVLPWVLGIGSAIGAVAYIRQSGITAQKAADLAYELKNVQEAQNVQSKVSALPDAVVNEQLRQFYRD